MRWNVPFFFFTRLDKSKCPNMTLYLCYSQRFSDFTALICYWTIYELWIKVYFNIWRDKIFTFTLGIKICKRKSSLAIPQIELTKVFNMKKKSFNIWPAPSTKQSWKICILFQKAKQFVKKKMYSKLWLCMSNWYIGQQNTLSKINT